MATEVAPAGLEAPDASPGGSKRGASSRPFTPEVKTILEEVYQVAAYPEEYVKYRLHLQTGLEVKQINNWFHNRRQKAKKTGSGLEPAPSGSLGEVAPDGRQQPVSSRAATTMNQNSLFMLPSIASLPRPIPASSQALEASAASTAPGAGPATLTITVSSPPTAPPLQLAHLASLRDALAASSNGAAAGAATSTAPAAAASGGAPGSMAPGADMHMGGAAGLAYPGASAAAQQHMPSRHAAALPQLSLGGGGQQAYALSLPPALTQLEGALALGGLRAMPAGALLPMSADRLAQPGARRGSEPNMASLGSSGALAASELPGDGGGVDNAKFMEADLEAVSKLVGLASITSARHHSGSQRLFLFEQLTYLDSLWPEESAPASKRRRTRHQHFWRNSDKFEREDRVYVQSREIRPALEQGQLVHPKDDIVQAERTNLWTVCLTARGVVNYLNKKVSPLGVRLFRQLLGLLGSAPGGRAAWDAYAPPPTATPWLYLCGEGGSGGLGGASGGLDDPNDDGPDEDANGDAGDEDGAARNGRRVRRRPGSYTRALTGSA